MTGLAYSFTRAGTVPSGPNGGPWASDHRGAWIGVFFTWLLLLVMTVPDNFDYSSLTTAVAPDAGSPMSRMLWMVLIAGPAGIVLWRRSLTWLLLRWVNPFLLAFCALAIASVLWSDLPSVTVRRFIRIAAVMLCALSFAVIAWDSRRFQRVIRPAITLILIGSLIFGLVRPDLAIHHELSPELKDAWKGLTNHKNSLGDCASIGVILWLHAWLSGEQSRGRAVLGIGVAMACLLLSRSSTSLLATAAVSALLCLLCKASPRLRERLPPLIVVSVLLVVVYSLIVLRLIPGLDFLLTPLSSLTGKDASFSGRTDIWTLVVEHFKEQPWLGSGYGAYWIGPQPWAPVYQFVLRLSFYPGSAHSGYLDVLNDLGLVGFACLLGYLALYLRDALRVFRTDHTQGALIIALFAQQVIANLAETHWFSVLSSDFVVMTFASVCVGRQLLDQRLRAIFGEPDLGSSRGFERYPPFPNYSPAQN